MMNAKALSRANLEYRLMKKYAMTGAGEIVRRDDGVIMPEDRPLFVCREDGRQRTMSHGDAQMIFWHYREMPLVG